MEKTTRKDFMKRSAAGVFWIPASRMFGQALPPLNKQVRMAVVGAGGMGRPTRECLQRGGATTVALCDVDAVHLEEERARMKANVPIFRDYRKMFDTMEKEFDAVCISTPDHTHGLVAIEAMRRGKHVYVQKPLAPTFEECAVITAFARKKGVVFQLGNQGHPGCKRYIPLRDAKLWGDILKIDSWTGKTTTRRMLKQMLGRRRPTAYPKPIPFDKHQDAASWELWCGPAPDHGYSKLFAPFLWRTWCDYGAGPVCDMGIHNMDPAFTVLELGMPYSICCQCAEASDFAFADGTKITMKFKPNRWLPNGVEMTWWDGEIYPDKPLWADPGQKFAGATKETGNGLMIQGSAFTTLGDSHAAPPRIIAETGKAWGASGKAAKEEWSAKVNAIAVPDHFKQFVDAARAADPKMCDANAEYAEPISQSLNLCALSTHFQNEELLFDAATKRITNNAKADAMLKMTCRPAWDVKKLAGLS